MSEFLIVHNSVEM